MLKPIIVSYKLTTCQLLFLTNTNKPREILLTISRPTTYCTYLPRCSFFVWLGTSNQVPSIDATLSTLLFAEILMIPD